MLVGFEMGLLARDDVGAWVDVEVERCEVVAGPLLELTTLKDKHEVDIAHLLNDLALRPSEKVQAPIALGILGELLRRKRITSRDAICQASRLADAISRDEYCTTLGLEDEYDLAEYGTYGQLDDAERAIAAFFERYRLSGGEP
ncbi:MAG: hypothetical protein ACHREM_14460 [Polyangiales bacterium]